MCFGGEAPFAGTRLEESLLYVVLTGDVGERPCPIALFLIDLETQASENSISENFMSEPSSFLSLVPKVCKPLAVKGIGLSGGLCLVSKVTCPGFGDSLSTIAISSCGLVAASSRLGLDGR